MKVRRTLMSALGAAMLILAVTVAPATAAGTTKLECVVGGVTSIKGPTPREFSALEVVWFDASNLSVTEPWLGGAKRWDTPTTTTTGTAFVPVRVEATFYGPPADVWLPADCA